jgi:endoglucanase
MTSSVSSSAANVTTLIKLNQVGYKPNAEKLAVIPAVAATTFTVKDAYNTIVLTADLSSAKTWTPSAESVKLADFSSITTEGTYTLSVEGVQNSASFKIASNAYDELNTGAIKAYYYNRASIDLLEEYAGVYKRAAGHADTTVYVHESAATSLRPANTIISAPKGWYDAGDYNLYIVNSGISTYTLLAAYEKYPTYFQGQNLHIPESGNAIPDMLDEALWNLDWMLSMQDPDDGGVYHKLTSKNFSGFVMPSADTSARYVVGKTTAAALDFAAVMATASRIYKPYDATLSTKMLDAAKAAWVWAKAHPAIYYSQPTDIKTGEYGDGNVNDEFAWAAAELYITTKEDAYFADFNQSVGSADVPGWPNVKSLGLISLAHNIDSLSYVVDKDLLKSRLNTLATSISSQKTTSAYGVPLTSGDFYWGSNSGALNKALMLTVAYELDNTKTNYLKTAQALLDYVLGRNPTDYSFVTGFGVKYPQNVHHRPSGADSIPGSIPGFVAGGANGDNKTDCTKPYPSTLPAKSYLDEQCSYMTNEIAINWNAPLVYVSAALQVLTE